MYYCEMGGRRANDVVIIVKARQRRHLQQELSLRAIINTWRVASVKDKGPAATNAPRTQDTIIVQSMQQRFQALVLIAWLPHQPPRFLSARKAARQRYLHRVQ